jgi:hypothetical protein
MDMKKRIEIELKPGSYASKDQLPVSENLNALLQNEYATRYLESIGAVPSNFNIEQVLFNFPLKDVAVMPVWIREKILIVPGISNTEISGDTTALVQELYRRETINTRPNPNKVSKAAAKLGYTSTTKKTQTEKILHIDNSGIKIKNKVVKDLTPVLKIDPSITEVFEYIHLSETGVLKRVSKNGLEQILNPPNMSANEEIKPAINNFLDVLSDFVPSVRRERDPSGHLKGGIKMLLISQPCVGLFALLTHHCYWTILHPVARRAVVLGREKNGTVTTQNSGANLDEDIQSVNDVNMSISFEMSLGVSSPDISINNHTPMLSRKLSASSVCSLPSLAPSLAQSETSLTGGEKERLFIQVQKCLSELHSKMGSNTYFVMSAHHALVSCCYFIVDSILNKTYAWLNEDIKNEPQTEMAVNWEDGMYIYICIYNIYIYVYICIYIYIYI